MSSFLLHHLFHNSVKKFPRNIAVNSEAGSINYSRLDQKSTLLASTLLQAGVKPRDVVAVQLTKSIEAVISFLAVLKCGATYIPLDGNYIPPPRIQSILEISKTSFVISNTQQWQHYLEAIDPQAENNIKKIIYTDNLHKPDNKVESPEEPQNPPAAETTCSIPKALPEPGIISEDLAYILYTSGSTGLPKGVMLSHLNALTFVQWAVDYFHPAATDVFASHAPFHFDLSVFDIYVTLASGATLELIPFKAGQNPRRLFNWMAEKELTYWYSVPSVWISILNFGSPDFSKISSIKKIIFAGEEFPSVYLKKLMLAASFADFYNLYGPTETNVCTAYHVPSVDAVTEKPVPIGQACRNTEIIILDKNLQPVSAGGEGELYVRGTTVTRGYFKDSERTKKIFIKSPLDYHQGALLYKTGDLVERVDENTVRFIGRIDHMVKVSGFRIELSDIASLLMKHEKINEAALTAIYNADRGSKMLFAFITLKPAQKCTVTEIKEYCAENLPYYMVPEGVIFSEKFPRTANGKVDLKKLSRPFIDQN